MSNKEFYDENRVFFSGRLTQDPILRYTKSKVPVLRFTLAVNYYIKENKETLFIPIVVTSDLALQLHSLLKKGSAVKVEGKLISRVIQISEQEEHKVFEVLANKVEIFSKKEE